MLKKIAFIFVVFLVLQSTADGKSYKWVDEKGGIHFSDQPPPLTKGVSSKTPVDTPGIRSFPLPQHGNLILSVPESWDHEISQPPGDLPPTIVLTPRQGDDFKVLITPIWSFKNEPGSASSKTIKDLISDNRTRMLPTAVERDVPIEEFQGKQGAGYYFIVTDKAPGDSYPYAVSAGIGVGDLLLVTTILARTRDSEGIRQTIQALQGAVQIKG